MITAQEAKELAGPFEIRDHCVEPAQDLLAVKLEALGVTVKQLAESGKRSCRTSWDHKEHNNLWVDGGYEQTREWKEAKRKLEELGYKVTFYFKYYNVGIDMYTLVEW